MKYFYTIGTLDKFNWAPCMNVPGLAKLINKNTDWWVDFWAKPDAKKITDQNLKKNEEVLGETVLTMQKSWHMGDF